MKRNVKPPPGIDAREVRCLKCGATFNLVEFHVCRMLPNPWREVARVAIAIAIAYGAFWLLGTIIRLAQP